jgi:uncharacterized membrane protein YoaK (UPF0700 family)
MDPKAVTSDGQKTIVASLFGLTLVTGVIDAVSFLGLGHVFTANMTGNVVFIGFSLGGAPDLSVARSLVALGAFATGSLIGGRAANVRGRSPAGLLVTAMSSEMVLLLGAAAATLLPVAQASGVYMAIVFTAVAMGLRNAVVRKLGVPDLTTTVLTLTVTGLAADSKWAGGEAPRQGRRLLSMLAMCAGALIGAVLLRHFGMQMALIFAGLVVAGLAVNLYTNERRHPAGPTRRPEDAAR